MSKWIKLVSVTSLLLGSVAISAKGPMKTMAQFDPSCKRAGDLCEVSIPTGPIPVDVPGVCDTSFRCVPHFSEDIPVGV